MIELIEWLAHFIQNALQFLFILNIFPAFTMKVMVLRMDTMLRLDRKSQYVA